MERVRKDLVMSVSIMLKRYLTLCIRAIIITTSILSLVNGSLFTTNTQEAFLQDFVEILEND